MKSYPLVRLIKYARGRYLTMFLATLCSILTRAFEICPEIIQSIALDVVVSKKTSFVARLGFESLESQLLLLGSLLILAWCAWSFFEYCQAFLWRRFSQWFQHAIRMEAYEHVQHFSMEQFEEKRTGDFLSILNDDVHQLERFLDTSANDILHIFVGMLLIPSIFFYVTPSIAFFVLLPIPVVMFASYCFRTTLKPRYRAVREMVANLASHITNNIMGIATIKSYTALAYEHNRIQQESTAYKNAHIHASKISAAFSPTIQCIVAFGSAAAIVMGGWDVMHGKLDVASYSILVLLSQRLLWSFYHIAEIADRYGCSMASADRLFNLIDTPAVRVGGTHALPLHAVRGEIIFDNISFAYHDASPVLNNFSLTIPTGHTVAFVGQTGSGKSTITKLLLRFYTPKSGTITIDNTNISNCRLHDLRQAIGLVGQDAFLMCGTIAENIAYGHTEYDQEKLITAARLAHIHDFVMTLPEKYATKIGDGARQLSGGQQQRIAIARALYKNPPIFVFDEATSAVDNSTESAIQQSLDALAGNHTTIIIAHRLSWVRKANCIYVIDQGRIAEYGTHDALLEKNGKYAELWRIQTGVTIAKNQDYLMPHATHTTANQQW